MSVVMDSYDKNYFEFGTSLLEMVLFIPLVFLFLFVLIDAGFAVIDKSALIDAVDSGMNISKNSKFIDLQEDGNFAVNRQSCSDVQKKITDEIYSNVLRYQSITSAEGEIEITNNPRSHSIRITTAVVTLQIDRNSGRIIGFNVDAQPLTRGNLDSTNDSQNIKNYVTSKLLPELELSPSGFAIPFDSNTVSANTFSQKYLPESVLFYVSAKTYTRGIAHSMVRATLDKLYKIEERRLRFLGR